jgi:hypothetical protein
MIIERGCSNHEDWVRLRQALWPDETAEEYRGYVLSLLNRTNDAIAKQPLRHQRQYADVM